MFLRYSADLDCTDMVPDARSSQGHCGGIGTLLMADIVKAFARKIVRQIGQVNKSDIENESRVVKLLMENGGHENIVRILGQGFIPSFDYFYIDMELCDMTLKDYIDYWAFNKDLAVQATPDLAPSMISNDCSLLLQMHNVWTIAAQIAAGLEFMHGHRQIHRDLKPGNGLNTL